MPICPTTLPPRERHLRAAKLCTITASNVRYVSHHGSAWSGDRQINQFRRCRHSSVVGHDGGQLATEQLRRGQVYGVETTQHARVECGRRIEKLFVDLDDVQPLQKSASPGERRGTMPAHGAKDLDSGEGTGGPFRFVTKIAAER